MDIPLVDGDQVPQPKDQIRIRELTVTPYPDRFRVHIAIQVTPFQERPNLVLVARDEAGQIVSELDVIETMLTDMEFTLHLRGVDDPAGTYTLTADVFYETRNPPQDRRVETFIIPEAESAGR